MPRHHPNSCYCCDNDDDHVNREDDSSEDDEDDCEDDCEDDENDNEDNSNCAGPQGLAGYQGQCGSQGFQGIFGIRGLKGAQGNLGGNGSQGSPGFQGNYGSPGSQGFQGLNGNLGSQGFQGYRGNAGFQGYNGDVGSQGSQGFGGYLGSLGTPGTQGFQGLDGPQNAVGTQGFQGLGGLGFVPAVARFYGMTAGTGNPTTTDYAATVAVGTAVPFPRIDFTTGGIVHASPTSFTLPAAGLYKVQWIVQTDEPGQLQLVLNGSIVQFQTTVGNQNATIGGHQICGNAYVAIIVTSDISVISPAGNSTALTITPASGSSTEANVQSITIERIL